MDIAEIRASFSLLGFEELTKNETEVKDKYRLLVLENSPDRTKDPEEVARRTEKVRLLHKAKAVCIAFCASELTEEQLVQAGELNEQEAHKQYLQRVELFIGRILQRRFRFWSRVALTSPTAAPEFDDTATKHPIENTRKGLFDLLYAETGREEVQWVWSFELEDAGRLAWVVMELTNGQHQALAFFTQAPGLGKVLPEVTHTALTIQTVVRLLAKTDLTKVRGVRGAEFWGVRSDDPWQIQVTGGGAALCWITSIGGILTPITFGYRAGSVEELERVLPQWVARVKKETSPGPL